MTEVVTGGKMVKLLLDDVCLSHIKLILVKYYYLQFT